MKKSRLVTFSVLVLLVAATGQLLGARRAAGASARSATASTITAVSAGGSDACVLLSNHTVKCWGSNSYGQLGKGGPNSFTPVAVSGLTTATQISVGDGYTCALLSNHTVKCWGANDKGQLGNGKTADSSIPVQVKGITNATQVSAGEWNTCAVLSNHTVKCWGDNEYGELGNGTTTNSLTPVAVNGLTTATQVSAGYGYYSCARLSTGQVKCWGDNYYGQLGDGTTDGSSTPLQVIGITSATQVSAGDNDTCARLSDGTARCWGINGNGQLGNGTRANSPTPVQVKGITSATAIVAGDQHACALLSNHTVKCWGYNLYGQLGNGRTTNSLTPVAVNGLTTATQVSAGENHSCSLLSTGAVKCWGDDEWGQLGNGTDSGSLTPVQVGGITNATQVSSTGIDDSCARLSSGQVKCWGDSEFGQLGDGVSDHGHMGGFGDDFSPTPVKVSGITTATQVSAGGSDTCALLSNHTIRCWGANLYGQLGDGTKSDSSTPVQVKGITTATQVSAGLAYTCAVLSNHTVKCWGANDKGELGNGKTANSSIPVQVKGITSATQVSAGDIHACARLSSGQVRCWGYDYAGQLGNGSWDTKPHSTPIQVKGITTATQVSAGFGGGRSYSCALLSNHTIKCWGYNQDGQLGDGILNHGQHSGDTGDISLTPVGVFGITNATQVGAGYYHACARLSTGALRCWGLAVAGELGDGVLKHGVPDIYGNDRSAAPVQVSGIANATLVSAGLYYHNCASLSTGVVKCWGDGSVGQLGNGQFYDFRTTPVSVIRLP